MKKSTGSILLLSAFGALILAGCGNDTNASSVATGSSDTAVQTSADETSTPAGTSESATGTSAAGTSTTTSSASSSAAASSSSAAASSSTPAVETDWSNKTFIGEYKGGMNSLIINTDKTTSWGTSTDKFPATYTELSTGVWMIKSAATVADEDYVEVITDGTMAYVMHDKEAYDYYVMDKNALGSAVIAFAETEDEEKFFGGIEVTAGHWKYFACINGTYTFGATITMQAGTNINAGGAIFDFGTGANKTSWKVTSAAVAATAFATIEQTNFTATTYTGDHGDLVIGTDNDGLVFAKLNGVALNDAQLSSNGTVLSVPNGSAATTYDTANAAGPMKVVPTTTYTLQKIALTYTQGEGTALIPLFEEVTGASGTYTGVTDEGGHLWVWFTAPVSGKITITEDVGTSYTDSYGDPYDYMYLYDTSITPATGYNASTTAVDYEWSDYYTGDLELTDVVLQAGHNYVVKVGASPDNSKDYKSTGSSYSGESLTLSWIFTPFALETYTGDAGDLVIEKDGSTTMSVVLNGQKMDSYTFVGNILSTSRSVLDMTNPADPVFTTTTSTFTLDPTTMTYTGTSTPVSTHPFHALAETDTTWTASTGNDGNIWMTFTPTKAGMITVTETAMGVSDSYLQVFEFGPNDDISDLTANGTRLAYTDSNPATVTVSVQAGVTYVIKLGAWGARNVVVGETTTTASYIGCSETISFSFVDYVMQTFTGAEGDLIIATKDGNYMSATLGGTPIAGKATYDQENGVYSVIGPQTLDASNPDDPVFNSTDDIYTLDTVNGTYTKVSQPGVQHVLNVLTDTSTGLSGLTGEDGNLWAIFTPTTDGLMSIDETVQATNGSGSHDTLLAVYEKTATTTWDMLINYSSSYNGTQQALNYSFQSAGADNGYNPVYVHFMPVQAGHTYIIKIGAYAGNGLTIGDQLASGSAGYAGQPEAFSFSFGQIVTTTYTNTTGQPLTIQTVGSTVYSVTLGTTAITNGTFSEDGKSFIVKGTTPTLNNSNPLDPIGTYTNTIYYLDNEGLTYETDTEVEEVHYFQTLSATDTSFTGTVGADGNLWGIFTAPEDGAITVEETVSTSGDGYIAVYESTATAFTSSNTTYKADSGAALSGAGKLTAVPVQKGHTYIIKAGNYYDRDKVIGGTGSSYSGKTETVSFTYTGYTYNTFTGDEGDLVQKYFGDTYLSATLNGTAFTASPNADQSVYTSKTDAFDSAEMKITSTTKTYTLGEGTYEIGTSSTETELLADTWTGGNTGTYETLDNGSVIIKITPTVSGTYTFDLAGEAGTDVKLGLYADDFNDTGFKTMLTSKDSGTSGKGETFTYDLTAGTTYYIRATYHYSDWSKAITSMTSTRGGNSLTITVTAPAAPVTPDPEPEPDPTVDPTPDPEQGAGE